MIEVIAGGKGAGKTPFMLAEMERELENESANIVFIKYGRRSDLIVPHSIRLIDITEYPVTNYNELIAFLAGLNAKDYDISHIYIDSIFKIAGDNDPANLSAFIRDLSALAERVNNHIAVAVSCKADELPSDILPYVRTDLQID